MNRWGELFARARGNHGIITLQLARGVGLSPAAVRARATAEGWGRLARGAWLVPGAATTPLAVASAHLHLLGERAAISHESAAHLHGLAREAPAEVQLIVPSDRRPDGHPGSRVHRSRTLTAGDVVEVQGLRTTSIPRTLRDLAPGQSWDDLYDVVTEAEQKGLTDLAALVATMHRLHHGPGSGVFRAVVEQRRADRSDSALERDTRDAARDAGFAPSAGPFPIRARGGALLRLDVAFPVAWSRSSATGSASTGIVGPSSGTVNGGDWPSRRGGD